VTPERVTNCRPVIRDVTVLVPTLGRPQLRDCLASLHDGDHWPHRLLVIDQGGGADCGGWVDELRRSGFAAVHVPQSDRGIGRAMNLGLSMVESPLVAVTHDDCRVSVDWLQQLVRAIRKAPLSIHTGRVEPEGNEPVPSVNTSPFPAVFRRPTLRGEMLFPANMGCTIDIARQIGPFEEDDRMATAAEDNEWCYRALRMGIPIRYGPEYAVRHLAWRDSDARARTYRQYARSQGTFYGKYLRRGDMHFLGRIVHECVAGSVRWTRGHLRRDEDAIHRARVILTDLLPGVWSGFIHPSLPDRR
jgi:glycosyltransferase involved in cell wall biosynthesis